MSFSKTFNRLRKAIYTISGAFMLLSHPNTSWYHHYLVALVILGRFHVLNPACTPSEQKNVKAIYNKKWARPNCIYRFVEKDFGEMRHGRKKFRCVKENNNAHMSDSYPWFVWGDDCIINMESYTTLAKFPLSYKRVFWDLLISPINLS